MKKAITIAKWEFIERAKSKAFIISFVLTPLIIMAFSFLPTFFATQDSDETKLIGIMDATEIYFNPLKDSLSSFTLENKQPRFVVVNLYNKDEILDTLRAKANRDVLAKKIEGYLLIQKNEKKIGGIELQFFSEGSAKHKDISIIEKSFNSIKRKLTLEKYNVSEIDWKEITANYDVIEKQITKKGEEKEVDFFKQYFSSFLFIILLFFLIVFSGGLLVRSLVEEKSNRLLEIIISSCTPNDLLIGKILGLSLLTFAQMLVWVLIGIAFGGQAIVLFADTTNLLLLFIYFISGFVLYTAIFVGIGSIVTTEQEAQQITSYLSMLVMFPIVLAIPAIENPDMPLMKFLSYFPLSSPSAMILRVNVGSLPLWEIVLTLAIIIVSTYIVVKMSSKIFRIGILSHGKMPSFNELKLWIKSK